jgi:hypothetical protein
MPAICSFFATSRTSSFTGFELPLRDAVHGRGAQGETHHRLRSLRCGGVRAALRDDKLGLIDNWLRHIQDVVQKHAALIARIEDETERVSKLCELNASSKS